MEAPVAQQTEHKPYSEPMVYGEGGPPVPVSEQSLVDPASVGVIDDPTPAALPGRSTLKTEDAPKAKK